jgi:hypothetical protein
MKQNRSKRRRKESFRNRETVKVIEKPKIEEDNNLKLIGIGTATRVAATAAVGTFAMLKPDSWATFFSESINNAAKSINYFIGGKETWNSFAQYILSADYKQSMKVSDVIAAMPKALGDQILNLTNDAEGLAKNVIDPKNLGLLVLIGVPLSVYLYVQLSGTDEEKEILEKKLQEAKRLSESSIYKKRRIQQLTDMDSSSEDSFSNDSLSSNKPQSKRSRRSRSMRRRNKNHV